MESLESQGTGAMSCYLKGCARCAVDLVFDEGYWRCLQCGQYYSSDPSTSLGDSYSDPLDGPATTRSRNSASVKLTSSMYPEEPPGKGRRDGRGARYARDINAVIRAKKASDERWWARNHQIIEYLDQGLSVREIGRLAGRGERQIRVIRERLGDIRAANGESAGKE